MARVPAEMRAIMRPAVAEMKRMFTTERPVTVYHPETGIPSNPLRGKMHAAAQTLYDRLWAYVQSKRRYRFDLNNFDRRGTPEGDAFWEIAPWLDRIKYNSKLGGSGQWHLIEHSLAVLEPMSAKTPEEENVATLGRIETVSKKGLLKETPLGSASGDLENLVKSYLKPKGARRKTRKGKGKSRKTLRRRR